MCSKLNGIVLYNILLRYFNQDYAQNNVVPTSQYDVHSFKLGFGALPNFTA